MDDARDDMGWVSTMTAGRPRGGGPAWASPGLLLGAALAVALGCGKDAPTAMEAEPAAPAAPGAPSAADRFDEAPFALRMVPKAPYAAGKAGEVEVRLQAKAGFKCNDQYPYKFKAEESGEVEYAAPVVKGDAMRHESKQLAVMTVRFTPKSSGKKTIAGQFSFSVCTEEQCLVERRDLSLAIDVD
jgi:hypothetical protein